MGIRPKFYILVGIDDAKLDDPRLTKVSDEFLEDILNFRELTREECWRDGEFFDDYHEYELGILGRTLFLQDKLYNPELSNEYAVGNVIGYIVHEGDHDSTILRALATFDSKYEQSGWERIPLLDQDKHWLRYRHSGYTEEDIRCNRFVLGVFESMPQVSRLEWKRAQHYLGLIGWTIPEEDLRYLLVWDWS